MTDVNVQPMKKSMLPSILLILAVIALFIFFNAGCNNDKANETAADMVSAATPRSVWKYLGEAMGEFLVVIT